MPDEVPPLSPDDLGPDEIDAAWAAVSAQMRSESYEELLVEAEPAEPTPKRHFREALILLATREPDLSLSELERRVGCSRGYASRIPEIRRLRQLARPRGLSARPRGYRRDDGDVEAVGE